VPLKTENDVLGVIEVAAFHPFRKHEIAFAEKVAESIASTLKAVQINTKTSELLEKSQQQAEEMAAQEEEMRQNMEELQATQEESSRKSEEFSAIINSIDQFLLKAEFDLNATLIYANELFLGKFNYSLNEAKGMQAEDFVAQKDMVKFQKILNTVMSGKPHSETTFLKDKKDRELKLITSFTPVYINENIEKILFLAVDINDY
jgi:PAS domain-containing protein